MLKIGLLLALLVAGAAFLVSCSQQPRKDALEKAAGAIGFRYLGEAGDAEVRAWKQLPSVAVRDQNFFSHVMSGPPGLPGPLRSETWSFDWTWREGMLKEGKREKQTVVAHRIGSADLGTFIWTARGALGKVSKPKMGEPLTFPDEPGFADRFDVAGPDHEAIRARFSPERRARLNPSPLPAGLWVEAAGEWIVAYYPGRELSPVEWEELVEATKPIASAFAD